MDETLRFNSITCDNFLPYYHETITFPKKDGVLIINGNNGHGKSSLITAIRFVLFGKFGGNVADGEPSVLEIINEDGFKKGEYSCSVTLDVDYLGNNYIITRLCSPKDSTLGKPKSSNDYKPPELTVMSKEGPLSEKEQNKLLKKIMDENLSRFYLFDGELLEEYKRLLSGRKKDESNKIKNAIENLLGLPLLTNAKAHLSELNSQLKEKYIEAAKVSDDTQKYAQLLDNEDRKLSNFKEQLKDWTNQLNECDKIINQCDDEKLQHEDDIRISERYATVKKELERIRTEFETLISEREKCLADAWIIPLYPQIKELSENYTKKSFSLENKKTTVESTKKTLEDLHSSLSSARCKWCNQCTQDDETKAFINDQINELQNKLDSLPDIKEITNELSSIRETKRLILEFDKLYNPSSLGDLQRNYKSIQDLEMEEAESKLEFSNLKDQLSNSIDRTYLDKLEETERKAIAKRENCSTTCAKLEKDIEDTNKKIAEINKKLDSLKYKNSALGEIESDKAKVSKLLTLFEKGIDVYRHKKRESVELSASSLYCKLSAVSVGGLRISENYTVSYYDKTGNELPRPSAGYSHLQAFALIGGLHQNMPIKGPLFLDTPSSRLDSPNTTNLLRIFPELSSQIILLITDKDFNKVELHNTLNEYIVAEYNIEKVTDTYSKIVKVETGGK